ncbi:MULTISPECIES: glutamine-hydrolyzing GMP synthase [Psychrilyobacter]|uniref:GMP synthase [glutamine-hydrolyzing] n=1 Tax=Psychrilyobacter piezotolerans TaxID=2293438 RepID=A0ABX9KJ55_9FUSO|nr:MULTISPECIES: glutamine-hydrolyzing GMP synthase [Psychrilyobacter]MCS5420787.1 glutamine-hydrolyzing GMP synthase [Psychrilyobacter sp. S5]NDI77419.1 glutamine-hydrolyzing GMP synthase [Psychrilyobacter piezotolerans]RDE63722.1 glutamine-hydrolyzing GMP synthase [Psychrilyobacter sp. S5]REI42066.1 glutamine-hydrolyzing GMP synthase [Psychrilyobacter piezotolerans]
MKQNSIVILDFGSQYNQLIARRVREMGVYAEVVPYFEDLEKIKARNPKGIILSGGPASVYLEGAPTVDKAMFDLDIPILGICYGMQLTQHLLGGEVAKADKQEFGKAEVIIDDENSPFFYGIEDNTQVWMSHGDHVTKIAPGFEKIAHTASSIATLYNAERNIYNVQFHPEVTHSVDGHQMLRNFVFDVCKCEENWSMGNYIEQTVKEIKETVGDKKVILALSGGVDSSVAAVLIHKAIGDQLSCFFVDTGLMRKNEAEKVMKTYGEHYHMNIECVDAEDRFLNKLKGVSDPETKRKIIGHEFIAIFDEQKQKMKDAEFLAQGTIYPDVIESQSVKGPSATIKSHHNVGGLPEEMDFKLLEPLRELFKDEVRKVGRELGIPDHMIDRHPFPGPGLGIRIIGEVDKEKADILREADDIFISELRAANLYQEVSQAFVVLLPVKSVGVMGDERTYEYTAVLRSADTIDFMTATWSHLPYEFLGRVSNRIINEVKGINRLAYDISSKPPATIEWE